MNTQKSDSEHTRRMSGRHAWRKAGEGTQKLETITAQTTGRMSYLPTGAQSGNMISVNARALER
jgi:hypothetical protein